ncbi:MAG TPA: hypothetical protein VGR85_05315 [Candidatus Limnocylindria bacterium]|nr:hypothetical protein [Candidatus Limnocylindria bacterium]
MPQQLGQRIRRSRFASSLAALAIMLSIALSPNVGQARVDPDMGSRAPSPESGATVAKVTGGGTVLAQPTFSTTIGSFGLNARRAVGFPGDGTAVGRIMYDRHRNSTGRLVNVPVAYMQGVTTNTPPNGTGGTATIVGNCMDPQATCPAGNGSAVVRVQDNSDAGPGSDQFTITFCVSAPSLPPPTDCGLAEGGTLRTGNIQIHPDAGVTGEATSTAAAAGVFATTPTFNGVELAGGIYSAGVRTGSDSAYGDLHVEYTGISLLGLYQIISVDAWITGVTIVGGTTTLTGTCTLDMGDGPPPTGGLAFTGTLTATGISVTVAGTSIPTLPKTDGFTVNE